VHGWSFIQQTAPNSLAETSKAPVWDVTTLMGIAMRKIAIIRILTKNICISFCYLTNQIKS
jgi:hypothetical protein